MSSQTFNYSQHNVCGGPSQRTVTQGPKKSICVGDKWINLQPPLAKPPKPAPQEGHYVTREKGGTMRPSDFKMLVLAHRARLAKPTQEPETTDQWLRRHKIGIYAD